MGWPFHGNAPAPALELSMSDIHDRFVKAFHNTAAHKNSWDVFRDFINLAARELDLPRIRSPKNIEESQAICARYGQKEIDGFHTLFNLLCEALTTERSDFLGRVYMSLEIGNSRSGQYFSPVSIQRLMAQLNGADISEQLRKQPFIELSEPTAGSGGFIIEYAELMRGQGHNVSQQLVVQAIDIDPVAADMTFVQLSLLGIAAEVITGNTLTLDVYDRRFTPIYYAENWTKRREEHARQSRILQFLKAC